MSEINGDKSTTLPSQVQSTLDRLLSIRQSLLEEGSNAPSPAVARSIEMADVYLFLAISYLGYTDKMYPEEP